MPTMGWLSARLATEPCEGAEPPVLTDPSAPATHHPRPPAVRAIPTEVEGNRLAPAGVFKGTNRAKSVRSPVRPAPSLRIAYFLSGGGGSTWYVVARTSAA